MSRSSDRYSDQNQTGSDHSRASALKKLQSQRLQRAGQRNEASIRRAMCHSSTSDSLHVVFNKQPLADATPWFDQQTSCQQTSCQPDTQQLVVSSHHGMHLVTTAVKGMQNRPPSRTSSSRSSCEHAQKQSRRHYATPGIQGPQLLQKVRPPDRHTGGVAAVQVCSPAINSAATGSSLTIAVHGKPLMAVQTLLPVTHEAVVRKAAMGIHAKQLATGVAAPLTHSNRAKASSNSSKEMGCGIPWHDLTMKVKAVRKRALHHSKQQKVQHRMSLALVVITQWMWFMRHQQQQRLAGTHYHRHLLTAGWQELRRAVSRQQLLQCQASLHAAKHAFMLLSRCFLAWQQLLIQQQHFQAAAAGLQATRARNLLQATVHEWRQQVAYLRSKRQLVLCAQAHRTFMSMLRCLQAWRGWRTEQQLKRLKYSRAQQHRQRTVLQHVLSAWRAQVAASAVKWQQLATALCFHKFSLQRTALRSWQLAVQEQQERRTAAIEVLQLCRHKQSHQLVKQALCCWQSIAQRQKQLRLTAAELECRLQKQRRKQVLKYWYQLVQYHQQLDTAASRLSAVSAAWWCRHYLDRWQHLVEVMAGQRSSELRELVQARACIGTWLKYTEQCQLQNTQLSAATNALQRRKLRCLLVGWQQVVAALQKKQRLRDLADHHYGGSQLRSLFLDWVQNAAAQAAERQQVAAADELHNSILLDHAWQAWHWYWWHNSMKHHVPILYQDNLQHRVLAAWRQVTARKMRKMLQHRQAVRHGYLSKLLKALKAWRQAVAMADHMQQLVQLADQHHISSLKARAYQAWHGPFLQQRGIKCRQLYSATSFCRRQLLQHAIAAWRAGMVVQKAECMQQSAAEQHSKMRLLQGGWKAFLLLHQQQQAERQQLAAAAEPAFQALMVLRQQQVLQAWRRVAVEEHRTKQQTVKAQQHYHGILQHKCVTLWKQYIQQCTAKAAACQRAEQHRQAELVVKAATALQRHVAAAVVKRQLLFRTAMHRRFSLLIRTWRAWRLTSAMSKLEAAGSPSETLQSLGMSSTPETSSSIRAHPGPCLDAVAAAVVAASCWSRSRWQQQSRQWWQQDVEKHKEQQLVGYSCDAMTVACEQNTPSQPMHDMQHSSSRSLQQQQREHHSEVQHQLAADQPVALMQPVVKRSATRRPPRLPSFLREGQQQQTQSQQEVFALNALDAAQSQTLQPEALEVPQESSEPHPMQQPGVVLRAAELGWPTLLASCSTQQGTARYHPHAHWYLGQQIALGCAVESPLPGGFVASAAADTCRTPYVRKRSRPQPRPLRQTMVAAPAATTTLDHSESAGHFSPRLCAGQDQPHLPDVLVLDQAEALPQIAAPEAVQQHWEQRQWQAHRELVAGTPVQTAMASVDPTFYEQHDHDLLAMTAGISHAHGSQDAVHDVRTGTDLQPAIRNLQDDSRAAAQTAFTSSTTAVQHQHVMQQHPSNTSVLPVVFGDGDDDLAAGETHHQHDQSLTVIISTESLPQSAAGSAGTQQQVPFTPLTRQMLHQEVAALEHTLQQCQLLNAAVQGRQQQASLLQQRIAALSHRFESAEHESAQQDHEQPCLELQEAQQQLSYVRSELKELLAEQVQQQPRLAAMAQRLQQFKAVAARQQLLGSKALAQLDDQQHQADRTRSVLLVL